MQQRGSGHMLRHRCTTPLLEDGDDSRTVQAWLGHKDVSPTMLYTQVLQRGGRGVRSPLHLCSVPYLKELWKKSPISVMVRASLERVLGADRLDLWYERTRSPCTSYHSTA